MTDERIQEIRELWRADLKAMDKGTYVPPLPHPDTVATNSQHRAKAK